MIEPMKKLNKFIQNKMMMTNQHKMKLIKSYNKIRK